MKRRSNCDVANSRHSRNLHYLHSTGFYEIGVGNEARWWWRCILFCGSVLCGRRSLATLVDFFRLPNLAGREHTQSKRTAGLRRRNINMQPVTSLGLKQSSLWAVQSSNCTWRWAFLLSQRSSVFFGTLPVFQSSQTSFCSELILPMPILGRLIPVELRWKCC
jgi:hypothetical protein